MRRFSIPAALVLVAVIWGCMQNPTSTRDHIYEGRKLMEEQDYEAAKEQFALAIEENERSSDARYWHAKAVWKTSGITFDDGMKFMNKMESLQDPSGDGGNLFTLEDIASEYDITNKIYKWTRAAKLDLKPIYDGFANQGFIQKKHIMEDYSIVTMVLTPLSLLDLFPPYGEIDQPTDMTDMLNISFDSLQNISLENAGALAESLLSDPAQIGQLLTVKDNVMDSKDVMYDLLQQTSKDSVTMTRETFDSTFTALDEALDAFLADTSLY